MEQPVPYHVDIPALKAALADADLLLEHADLVDVWRITDNLRKSGASDVAIGLYARIMHRLEVDGEDGLDVDGDRYTLDDLYDQLKATIEDAGLDHILAIHGTYES